jgi:mycothiol S-conjugate amidase
MNVPPAADLGNTESVTPTAAPPMERFSSHASRPGVVRGTPRDAAGNPLSLLTVHAHPDDESSKGAATVARYYDEGVRTVLVCCTGGELGDIANPAMDLPGVKENLTAVRREELATATSLIGFDDVVLLGYRDSGMAESEGNNDPRSFHRADLDESVGRLVEIIRRERPQVIVTYGDNQQGYPHPDHLKVHDITLPAFSRAGDPSWYPEAGPVWQPSKLYYSTWARARIVATHAKFLELGMESPYDEKWLSRPWQDHRITTRVAIDDYYDVRVNALLAHATQIDPNAKWWFGIPHEVARTIHPFEDYILARSLVEGAVGEDVLGPGAEGGEADVRETDLFAGVRRH